MNSSDFISSKISLGLTSVHYIGDDIPYVGWVFLSPFETSGCYQARCFYPHLRQVVVTKLGVSIPI